MFPEDIQQTWPMPEEVKQGSKDFLKAFSFVSKILGLVCSPWNLKKERIVIYLLHPINFLHFCMHLNFKKILETVICTRLIITYNKDTGERHKFLQYTISSSPSRHTQNRMRINYIQMVLMFRILILLSLLQLYKTLCIKVTSNTSSNS